mmetsp:Transcript_62460/g.86306  ORF Transcript_62460/g.86306 Transcript_62460/m.86306 type:complete len:180 (-) Transcript_62460:124-663(-)
MHVRRVSCEVQAAEIGIPVVAAKGRSPPWTQRLVARYHSRNAAVWAVLWLPLASELPLATLCRSEISSHDKRSASTPPWRVTTVANSNITEEHYALMRLEDSCLEKGSDAARVPARCCRLAIAMHSLASPMLRLKPADELALGREHLGLERATGARHLNVPKVDGRARVVVSGTRHLLE